MTEPTGHGSWELRADPPAPRLAEGFGLALLVGAGFAWRLIRPAVRRLGHLR